MSAVTSLPCVAQVQGLVISACKSHGLNFPVTKALDSEAMNASAHTGGTSPSKSGAVEAAFQRRNSGSRIEVSTGDIATRVAGLSSAAAKATLMDVLSLLLDSSYRINALASAAASSVRGANICDSVSGEASAANSLSISEPLAPLVPPGASDANPHHHHHRHHVFRHQAALIAMPEMDPAPHLASFSSLSSTMIAHGGANSAQLSQQELSEDTNDGALITNVAEVPDSSFVGPVTPDAFEHHRGGHHDGEPFVRSHQAHPARDAFDSEPTTMVNVVPPTRRQTLQGTEDAADVAAAAAAASSTPLRSHIVHARRSSRPESSADGHEQDSSVIASSSLAAGVSGGGLALVKKPRRVSNSSHSDHHQSGSGATGGGSRARTNSNSGHLGAASSHSHGSSDDGPAFIPIEQILNEESQNAVFASLRQRSLLRMLAVQPPARFLRQAGAAGGRPRKGSGGPAQQPLAPHQLAATKTWVASTATALPPPADPAAASATSMFKPPSPIPSHAQHHNRNSSSGGGLHHVDSDLAPISLSGTHYHPSEDAVTAGDTQTNNHLTINPQLVSAETNLSSAAAASIASCNRSRTHEVHEVREFEDELGFVVVNGYILLEEVGRGKFGVVYLASSVGSGAMRAIKVVPKALLRRQFSNSGAEEQLMREIAIMKKLRHRNIVALLEVIDDPKDCNMYLVMPYIERGPIVRTNADGTCTPLDLDIARGYLRQIAAGLHYLHEHRVAHRDIKPDNLLLGSDGVVYLTDFGVSDLFEDSADEVRETRGTPAFSAPETLTGAAFALPPTDIWALGVTGYVLVFGRLPFRGQGLGELNERILHGEPDFTPPSHGDGEAHYYGDVIALLRLMLDKNPLTRPTIGEVRRHRFFRSRWSQDAHFSVSMMNSTVTSPSNASATMAHSGSGMNPFGAATSNATSRTRPPPFADITLDVTLPNVLPLVDAPPFMTNAAASATGTGTTTTGNATAAGGPTLVSSQSTISTNSRSATLPQSEGPLSTTSSESGFAPAVPTLAISLVPLSSRPSPAQSEFATTAGGSATAVLIHDRFGHAQYGIASASVSPRGPETTNDEPQSQQQQPQTPAQPNTGVHQVGQQQNPPHPHQLFRPPGLPPIETNFSARGQPQPQATAVSGPTRSPALPSPASTSTSTSTSTWSGRLIESAVRLDEKEIDASMTPLTRKALMTNWTGSSGATAPPGSPLLGGGAGINSGACGGGGKVVKKRFSPQKPQPRSQQQEP